jgi:hypothetical protein
MHVLSLISAWFVSLHDTNLCTKTIYLLCARYLDIISFVGSAEWCQVPCGWDTPLFFDL